MCRAQFVECWFKHVQAKGETVAADDKRHSHGSSPDFAQYQWKNTWDDVPPPRAL